MSVLGRLCGPLCVTHLLSPVLHMGVNSQDPNCYFHSLLSAIFPFLKFFIITVYVCAHVEVREQLCETFMCVPGSEPKSPGL